MTTIAAASGKVTVGPDAVTRCSDNGKLTCSLPVQDYIPPQPESLSAWIDTSLVGVVGGSVPRSAPPGGAGTDDTAMAVDEVPRALPGFQLPRRTLTRSLDLVAPSVAVAVGTVYAMARQNSLPVLALDALSAGMTSTWGPFTATWTVAVFVRADRLCDAYQGVPGLGAMTLLASGAPTGGDPTRFTVALPRGGAVPAAAIQANGGPLDGVAAGAPLDVACVNQWRLVALRNDPAAAGGQRAVLLDGYPVATAGAASTLPVPVGSAVVIGAGCTAAIAEVLVWSCAVSDAELRSTTAALRVKWNVPTLAAPPPPSGSTGGAAGTLAATAMTGVTTVAEVRAVGFPVPDCWLDASCADTLFADAALAQPAVPGGSIAAWRDCAGRSLRLTFAADSAARWATEGVQRLGGRPVVAVAGAGTFSPPLPLGSAADVAGGFTVVAVWRVLARPVAAGDTPNGHPFAPNAAEASFDLAAWRETLGVDNARVLPVPGAELGLAAGDAVLACWERTGPESGSAVTWRLNNLVGGTGGRVWTGTDASTAWTARCGGVGANLHLAELLVWRNRTLTASERAALGARLAARWGLSLPAGGQVSGALPTPTWDSYPNPVAQASTEFTAQNMLAPYMFNTTLPIRGNHQGTSWGCQAFTGPVQRVVWNLESVRTVLRMRTFNYHEYVAKSNVDGAYVDNGVRKVCIYVMATHPTTTPGSNVSANDLVYDGDLQKQGYPQWDVLTWFTVPLTAQRTGQYVVIDTFTGWNAGGIFPLRENRLGIRRMEIGSVPYP